ncbi:endonuclease/exonuclease/phosphatase family protein [Nocardioides caeni]|uniref:Endonuclease/exonuclease/phosphatase domain-containing protein n=1 Tax=Nocardioides caeni TaxID=574700 RepID=A0A4S8NMG7_9ACTN|nr:endonuclease/exonuclease/phosphatase family protein [Nocardioides caeni]THV18177.1 hypothetical protein E9934_00560 [Nocardioides caeni]
MTESGRRVRRLERFSMPELLAVAAAGVVAVGALSASMLVDTETAPAASTTTTAALGSTVTQTGDEPETEDVEGEVGDGAVASAPAADDAQRYEGVRSPLAEEVENKVAAEVEQSRPATSSFRIATLNVLGSNHARNGLGRASAEAGLIKSRGIEIVGLQEVQRDQRGVFINNLSHMQMWPQDALGRDGYRVQIMWRTDRFEMVDNGGSSHTFNSIGSVPIPFVLLKDKTTGAQFWVIATHHSPNGLQSQRDASTRNQVSIISELRKSGHPVFLLGDMNEKSTFFCEMARDAGMIAANGGGYNGGCSVPGGPLRIDWILGTGDGTSFSGYVQDGTTKSQGWSDHYLIYADAKLTDTGTNSSR